MMAHFNKNKEQKIPLNLQVCLFLQGRNAVLAY